MPDLDPIEAEVKRRLAARAKAVKYNGVERSLKKIESYMAETSTHLLQLDKRADESNHIKGEMLTKAEFNAYKDEDNEFKRMILDRLGHVITVETLRDGDKLVQWGIPGGLNEDQIESVRQLANREIRSAEDKKKATKWNATIWGRIAIAAGLVVAMFTLLQTVLFWYVYVFQGRK